jgi:hypothetical protein
LKCERSSWGIWKDTHGPLRTLSKSCWSFPNSPDIRTAFTGWILNTDDETYDLKEPSDGFVDAFIDLMIYINTFPPGTPVNVEWNKNLPYYVLTGDNQRCKSFTDLPKDFPFAYGSLTASRKSFRPCLGPKNTPVFHVPGLEFFATSGVYKDETE